MPFPTMAFLMRKRLIGDGKFCTRLAKKFVHQSQRDNSLPMLAISLKTVRLASSYQRVILLYGVQELGWSSLYIARPSAYGQSPIPSFACLPAPHASTFTNGLYFGSHICSRTHPSSSASLLGRRVCVANPSSTACWMTTFAICPLISQTSTASGSSSLSGSCTAGS